MSRKDAIRLEPAARPASEDPALVEISGLPRLAEAIRLLTEDGGAVPADSKLLEAAIRRLGMDDVKVEPEHVDALVALGTLERVMIGRTLHLVWRSDASDDRVHVPRTAGPITSDLTEDDLRFRLDIELDIEHERLLLYRVILILELVAGALLVRQALLWYLQG